MITPDIPNKDWLTVPEAQQYAPLVVAWSKEPMRFYVLVQADTSVTGDDRTYTIKETEITEEDRVEIEKHYTAEQWELSLIQAVYTLTDTATTAYKAKSEEEFNIPLTLLIPPVFRDYFLSRNIIEKPTEEQEDSLVTYIGSIKINDQLYYVRVTNQLPSDNMLVGVFVVTTDEARFSWVYPIGKIIVMNPDYADTQSEVPAPQAPLITPGNIAIR